MNHDWVEGHHWVEPVYINGKPRGTVLRIKVKCSCGAHGFRRNNSSVVYSAELRDCTNAEQ